MVPINAQTAYEQRTPSTASAVTSGTTVIVQLQGGKWHTVYPFDIATNSRSIRLAFAVWK